MTAPLPSVRISLKRLSQGKMSSRDNCGFPLAVSRADGVDEEGDLLAVAVRVRARAWEVESARW